MRALAVLSVFFFHASPQWWPGGWLGVDVFFVLSGFLITSLLIRELEAKGRIDLRRFWLARARRLFPALALMLVAVLSFGAVWTMPARLASLKWDVLATLAYVANWRMMLSNERYFATLAFPSPLRHAWSLGVEEQFYIAFPLILLGLAAWLRTSSRILLALTVLAGASVAWAAYLHDPAVDVGRVYYGTDTRAFELLIGAVGGLVVTASSTRLALVRESLLGVARGAGPFLLIGMVACLGLVQETQTWLFEGGLALLALASLLLIVTAFENERTLVVRVLSWGPLRALGIISYGLYLWHWPVIVFLNQPRTGLSGATLVAWQGGVTLAAALVSYLLVERRVRHGGFRALVPGRRALSLGVVAASVPALSIAAFALPSSPGARPTITSNLEVPVWSPLPVDRHQPIDDYPPVQAPPTPTYTSVFLLGNSIPFSLAYHFPAKRFPYLIVNQSTFFGCDVLAADKVVDGLVESPDDACRQWRSSWPAAIKATQPNVVMLWLTAPMLDPHVLGGGVVDFDTERYRSYLRSELDRVRKATEAAAPDSELAIVTLSCHQIPNTLGSDEVDRTNDVSQVQALNSLATDWAAERDVAVIDQYAFLCDGGYHDAINGAPLYEDYMHFTAESALPVWSWLAPQLHEIAGH